VNLAVIWCFLPNPSELIQNFVCKERNCNNYTDTNTTVQNLLAQDLCTRVVLHSCYSVNIHHHRKFKSLCKHVDICLKTVPIVWLLFCTRICLITRFSFIIECVCVWVCVCVHVWDGSVFFFFLLLLDRYLCL
jgi:hypothetical protein